MRINLNEAIEIINANVSKFNKKEVVSIKDINGTISAQDVYSKINIPPFDRSPLDGYALIADDTKSVPVTLNVVDNVFAGHNSTTELKTGEAIRIMTGAPIPKGANCVIRQEDTDYGVEKVTINKNLKPNSNICFKGEDIEENTLVVEEGEKLTYVHQGILASVGVFEIEIYKKPKVLLLISGDEVVENGILPAGKIYDSNSYTLSGRLKEIGIYDIEIQYVADDINKTIKTIEEKIDTVDFIISTGGVSVGKKDFMPEVMEKIGAVKKFHWLNLKPGSPAMFSILKGKPILSLSGNPFASLVTFELLAKPILYKLTNDDFYKSVYKTSIMGDEWKKKSDKQRYIRAVEKDGKVYFPKNHSSGSLFSMKGCNCLIVIEEGNEGISIGDEVTIITI